MGLQVSQAVAAKEVRVRVQGDTGELASELCTGSVCSWDFMFPKRQLSGNFVVPNSDSAFLLREGLCPNMVCSRRVLVFDNPGGGGVGFYLQCQFYYHDGIMNFGVVLWSVFLPS